MPEERPSATRAYHPRIAVIFDFDRTLAPSSFDALLRHCGVDPDAFDRERLDPLTRDGFEDLLARMYALSHASRERGGPVITRDTLAEVGRGLELFPGVPGIFDVLRDAAHRILEDIEVEFYVLTCGLVQMHREHPVSAEFDAMWGCELHFDQDGRADFAKQIVTFPEKVRYLLQLAKGLGVEGPNAPADVYRDVPDRELHVPISQMVYVGDGVSDMPAFGLMQDNGGLAIGVVNAEEAREWSGYSDIRDAHRVQNLATADYREGSELHQALVLSVESIAKLIALRKLGFRE